MKQRKHVGAEALPAQQWDFDSQVYVRLEQRIPPGDSSGSWKDTGRGFFGTVVNGPQPTNDTPEQLYTYVLPCDPERAAGNAHPIQISGNTFDPHGHEPILEATPRDGEAGRELCRFVVVAIREVLQPPVADLEQADDTAM